MNKVITATVFAVGAVFVTACVSTSNIRDASALNQISVGSPKAEVVRLLGNPTSSSAKGGGVECLDYKFTRVGQSQYSSYEQAHFVTIKNGKTTCYGEKSCESIFSTYEDDYRQCM